MKGLVFLLLVLSLFYFGPIRAWCADGPAQGSEKTPQESEEEAQKVPDPVKKEPASQTQPVEPQEAPQSSVKEPANGATEGDVPQSATEHQKVPDQAPKEPAGEPDRSVKEPAEITFLVSEYQVEGNTILPQEKIKEIVSGYLGPKQRLKDVDQARLALEKTYHDAGYPTVLVVLPQQTIENGIVRFTVIESKLGKIKITGNYNFTDEEIRERLPSLKEGILIYAPTFMQELKEANMNPDLVITPVLTPGQELGTANIELAIKDRLPLHASLEWNNQGTPNTPRQRINGSIQFSNLFNRDQIFTLQTTQSIPGDAVQVYGGSYVIPLKKSGRTIAFYGAYSHSDTALNGGAITVSGGSVGVAGNSSVVGGRYIFPVGNNEKLAQQVSLGIDYTRLKENKAAFPDQTSTNLTNPLNYLPLSVGYTALRPDKRGTTSFSSSLRGYVAGMVPGGDKEDFGGDPSDLQNMPGNRLGSTGTFAVLRGGVERLQDLPKGFSLLLKADGQWASEPLIPAEQYFAGGVDTVRGYLESEELGDDAVHATVELSTPTLPALLPDPLRESLRFTAFYDFAYLWVKEAPPGQIDHHQLSGTGFGIRLKLTDYIQGRMDLARALDNAAISQRGELFLHLSVKGSF